MLWIVLGVFAGLVLPIQTVINTRLRQSTGTPTSSSLISFSVGTLCLTLVAVISTGGHLSLAGTGGQPWWIFTGGLFGVVALTGNILLFPRLGAVQTVVLPIAGQVLMGLVVDHFGLFQSLQSLLTVWRALGALIVLIGVVLVVRTGAAPAKETGKDRPLIWQILGFVFGCFTAIQSAINGHLSQLLASPVMAALVSFAVGMTTLILINIVLRWRPHISQPTSEPNPWWMWFGGALGAFFIFGNALLVPRIGTGLTVVAGLLGMMTGSLLVDRVRGQRIAMRQVLGVLVILAGVALIRLS